MFPMEDYEEVATYSSEIEAEVAQSTLAAAGIESFLRFEDTGGMLPSLQQTEGVRLLVERDRLTEARALLTDNSTNETEQ